jgi:hypothetical protein
MRARAGVTAIFFADGLCIGAWAVAIPGRALSAIDADHIEPGRNQPRHEIGAT